MKEQAMYDYNSNAQLVRFLGVYAGAAMLLALILQVL